jgi:hypothetical protein
MTILEILLTTVAILEQTEAIIKSCQEQITTEIKASQEGIKACLEEMKKPR